MLIVIALVFGATAGAIIHFAMPHRDTRGPALAPIVGAVIAGGVWLLFTWMGMGDTGWIWLAGLGAPIVLTWIIVAVLSPLRLAHDRRERVRHGLA